MAYNYETQHDAYSFTKGREGKKVDKIVVHWWGDPAQNPSYEGVINWFKNPNAGTSAHFVATGTGRRVAQLVDLTNTAWHAGNWNANTTSIGIELDPRCRTEDYDVAAELIADIRSAVGDVPLYWHNNFTATRCPGNWDVEHLDRLSYTKYSHPTDWGKGGTIQTPKPPVIPAPEPKMAKLDNPVLYTAKVNTPVLEVMTGKVVATIKAKEVFRAFASITHNDKTYFVTEYSYAKGFKNGVLNTDLQVQAIPVPTPEPEQPVEPPVTPPVEPPILPEPSNPFVVFLTWLIDLIKSIWSKDK